MTEVHSFVTIKSASFSERAVVSGGVPLMNLEWNACTEERCARGTESGKEQIFSADLSSYAVRIPGFDVQGLNSESGPTTKRRLVRARFPNTDDAESKPNYIDPKTSVKQWITNAHPDPDQKVFRDLAKAGLKNDSAEHGYNAYTVGVGGVCARYDQGCE